MRLFVYTSLFLTTKEFTVLEHSTYLRYKKTIIPPTSNPLKKEIQYNW